jgi:hypothetical protein
MFDVNATKNYSAMFESSRMSEKLRILSILLENIAIA